MKPNKIKQLFDYVRLYSVNVCGVIVINEFCKL